MEGESEGQRGASTARALRILVGGCGSVGSVFACLLARAGHRVTAVARGAHARAIVRDGIRVCGIWGDFRCGPVSLWRGETRSEGPFDAVLVACKTYQTADLLAALGDPLAADGVAISLQNGLGNVERLEAHFGAERTLASRVIFGAERTAPGRVRVTVQAEPVLVGGPHGADPRAKQWAEVFHAAGVPAESTDDILRALWAKVLYNAALNPLGALLGLRYGELAADADRRRIMNRVIDEAFQVAVAEGVRLPWPDSRGYLKTFYDRLVPSTADHRSSMLQDLERGKPTEIDAICGEVCRRGDLHGIDTDVNRLLWLLVSARTGSRAGPEQGERE